jgi:superfamily I DNA/RNA helicase
MNIVPSEEQQAIIDAAKAGHNIVVDAVAGSGKTTTILSIAKNLPEKNIVQVTFNSQLKIEVREKISQMDIGNNIVVHTYHSLATTFYDSSAWNDGKMMEIIDNAYPIKQKAQSTQISPSVIIIDEAQDMTLLYFRMVNKFICDFCNKDLVQIIVMGDKNQAVYSFMQADARFLTMAPSVWNKEFKFMTLCESYRLTKPIAWFVNKTMVKHDRIISKKPGMRVEYHICNPFAMPFMNDILTKLKSGILKPEDIFILSASLKSQGSPARKVENAFVSAGIPVYVPIADDARMDEDLTRGKVIFATFPSSKGRERKVVIVLGFDAGYFKYFAKNEPSHICPSTLYVAVTRAKERLILVENHQDEPLPFLNLASNGGGEFSMNVNIVGNRKQFRKQSYVKNSENNCITFQRNTSPCELVRYLKQSVIQGLTPLVNKVMKCIHNGTEGVNVPGKVKSAKSDNQFEDVSDLNGIVIPLIWESKVGSNSNNMTTIATILMNSLSEKSTPKILKTAISKIKLQSNNVQDYIHTCNVYQAYTNGYHGRLAQIKHYNWLETHMIDDCHNFLNKYVAKQSLIFEHMISSKIHSQYGDIIIS